jgi:hypothetical protein
MSLTQNNPQYNPLIATIVNNRNWAPMLAELGRGFAKPLAVIDAMNPAGSFSVESPDGSMRVAFQPLQEVTQIISAVAQAGANLTVTVTDPLFTGFRPKTIVMDSAGNQAYVQSWSANVLTLSPATYPTALVSTSHFLVGRSLTSLGSSAGNQNSTGVDNLYKTNDYRTNYSAVYRETHQVSNRDKFVSYKFDETYYSWVTGEMDMVERFAKYKVLNMIYSEPGQFNGIEGVTNRYEGLRAAIRNQGGKYTAMTSLFTAADFESDLDFMASTNPDQYQSYMWIGGRAAWKRINDLYGGTNIAFTVSKAVINGNELNFDIPQATINGITVKFMVWGVFDNIKMFPLISSVAGAGYMESNTYFMINTDPIPAVGGGTVPVIRKFHFAHSQTTGGVETLYGYIPGLGNSIGSANTNGYPLIASPVMGAQYEIAEDAGYDIQADACVYRHLVA